MVFKKAKKQGLELTKVSLVTGFGGSVVAGIPGGQPAGLTNFSRSFGPAGTILGGELVLDRVKGLRTKSKSKRGRRNGIF